nr:MAG TPA: hypothetical protein [Caudoviricetes sp.]
MLNLEDQVFSIIYYYILFFRFHTQLFEELYKNLIQKFEIRI